MFETAWLLPILWYTWQLQDARSRLRANRACLAILAEQAQPQGPHNLAEVYRLPSEETAATKAQDRSQHLAEPGQQSYAPNGVVPVWLAGGESLWLLRNRMRETFTSGSVGRAPGNRCLYPEADLENAAQFLW